MSKLFVSCATSNALNRTDYKMIIFLGENDMAMTQLRERTLHLTSSHEVSAALHVFKDEEENRWNEQDEEENRGNGQDEESQRLSGTCT